MAPGAHSWYPSRTHIGPERRRNVTDIADCELACSDPCHLRAVCLVRPHGRQILGERPEGEARRRFRHGAAVRARSRRSVACGREDVGGDTQLGAQVEDPARKALLDLAVRLVVPAAEPADPLVGHHRLVDAGLVGALGPGHGVRITRRPVGVHRLARRCRRDHGRGRRARHHPAVRRPRRRGRTRGAGPRAGTGAGAALAVRAGGGIHDDIVTPRRRGGRVDPTT